MELIRDSIVEYMRKRARDFTGTPVADALLPGRELELVADEIVAMFDTNPPQSVNATIIRAADIFGVTMPEILGGGRHKPALHARWSVMHYAMVHLGKSSPEVAHSLGDMDHSSILHARKRVTEWLKDADHFDFQDKYRQLLI